MVRHWVYGQKGAFTTPCIAEGRKINVVRERKRWCSQPENVCCQRVQAGNKGGPVACSEEDYPCNDVMAFKRWAFSSGWFHKGPRRKQPIPMLHGKVGKLAFFTSRPFDRPEKERRVIGCFTIGQITDESGEYWVSSDQQKERLRIREFERAPRYWDFYQQAGGPLWGSGLFRYLPDPVAEKLYEATRKVAGR